MKKAIIASVEPCECICEGCDNEEHCQKIQTGCRAGRE